MAALCKSITLEREKQNNVEEIPTGLELGSCVFRHIF